MKKKLAYMATGIILLLGYSAQAQSIVETALLFGRTRPGGSARIQAMGGAQVSLGGDYSSAFSNAAGLGMFNRSEFSISPGMNFSSTNSNYLGNPTSDSRSNFFIPGISAVFHKNSAHEDGSFLGGSFAFTFNHTNTFNSNFNYEGVNPTSSIVDYFINDAYPSVPGDLLPGGNYANNPTGLAYTTYLLDTAANSSNTYVSPVGVTPRTVNQQERVTNKGSQKQWSLSYGANFSDKIFIGAGIGFTSLRYESDKTFTESDYHFSDYPSYNPLTSMTLNENLVISGSGVNANLGIIARPVDFVQVGFSFTTPTLYQLTDSYSAKMTSAWNNFDYYNDGSTVLNTESASTQQVVSQYTLKTPAKVNFGATVFIQKQGLITADVELINYSGAKYSATNSGISYNDENSDIKTLYAPIANYRVGGEYRLKDFRLRAGYAFMPDPYRSIQDVNNAITSVSGGAGYRAQKFYLDLATVFTSGNTSYVPYTTSPLVTTKNKNTAVILTLGFPF